MEPLAETLRPTKLSDCIGQEHILAPGTFLYELLTKDQPTSLLLWGPPGTGKTTLARLMGTMWNAEFIELSAVTSGIADVRQVIEHAKQNKRMPLRTLLFIDEIHRFNKAQQDAFLPHVENGTFILVGATTENPSFEIIGALQSRTRTVVLQQLSKADITKLVRRASTFTKHTIQPKALSLIAEFSSGDARAALNVFESAHKLAGAKPITSSHVSQALQKQTTYYDKNGDKHYDIISAFIKSMRGSNEKAATYYLQRMLQAGEDPKFIARRAVIFASEDIGLANPHALTLAVSTYAAVERIGMPECEYALTQVVMALCQAKKSRSVADVLHDSRDLAVKFPNADVPLHMRNAPTKLMKDLGYNEAYEWKADFTPEKGFMPKEIPETT